MPQNLTPLTTTKSYQTAGQIQVDVSSMRLSYVDAILPILSALDEHQGALFASSFEYPGRYTRFDIGFVNPPLMLTSQARHFTLQAQNDRGKILLPVIHQALQQDPALIELAITDQTITGHVTTTTQFFPEELRSQQPSIFTVIRRLTQLFQHPDEPYLGLFGAFSYDLAFQFEPIHLKQERNTAQRDLVLYLPDEIYVVDHRREVATCHRYDFKTQNDQTHGLLRDGLRTPYQPSQNQINKPSSDHQPGDYAACVRRACDAFKRGDLFEVVISQLLQEPTIATPSQIFKTLRAANPAPYGTLINLGDQEFLVGASPEMFVRVNGRRVETCPISGTIARGQSPIEDAKQIQILLNSTKDESELTMCTDVDRNDKSRICEPGSVQVIGRRQVEIYSRLIHTVDHVEGFLRPEFDALDAFLTHAWVVTVTGAPKRAAMQFIENEERSPRLWYGAAIGWLNFNGDLNTGLTIRTIRLKNGIAEVRVGATLLYDSIPEAEEAETQLKASALLTAIRNASSPTSPSKEQKSSLFRVGQNKRIVLIDHEDSFVHTLANYLRQTGALVTTVRAGIEEQHLRELAPHLVVLSPGPGSPQDFKLNVTIKLLEQLSCGIFGVCLGLQALVEYFGGELATLAYPMHGKPSTIHVCGNGGRLFAGLPTEFTAARYHSLYAKRETFPAELTITAESSDGIIMAIEHPHKPICAVQFHPESILSLEQDIGLRLIHNVVRQCC